MKRILILLVFLFTLLIAFGIITFIILFLLFSRSIVANERLISFFGVLGLLIVFEFINLLIHPWLASFTHESPVLMLLVLVIIASLLIPLHHRLEKWIKEKMIEKNKAITDKNNYDYRAMFPVINICISLSLQCNFYLQRLNPCLQHFIDCCNRVKVQYRLFIVQVFVLVYQFG